MQYQSKALASVSVTVKIESQIAYQVVDDKSSKADTSISIMRTCSKGDMHQQKHRSSTSPVPIL